MNNEQMNDVYENEMMEMDSVVEEVIAEKEEMIEDEPVSNANCVDEYAIVGEETQVFGNITTNGHLTVAGTVEGNIAAKGNVVVTGMVKGTINSTNLMLDYSIVNAPIIQVAEKVVIKENSTVAGNITCKELFVNGSITGNITVTDCVAIAASAQINGDIKAGKLTIEAGAKISGRVTIG